MLKLSSVLSCAVGRPLRHSHHTPLLAVLEQLEPSLFVLEVEQSLASRFRGLEVL